MAGVQKCVFTGAVLLGFSRTFKGGTARFAANLTETLKEKLQIEDLPESLGEGKATETELAATNIALQSTKGNLAEYEIHVNAQRVHHFELVRMDVPNSKNKAKRTEVRFQVSFADLTGCAFLEQYMVKAGDSKGTLTVSFTEQPVQQELTESPDQTQKKLEATE